MNLAIEQRIHRVFLPGILVTFLHSNAGKRILLRIRFLQILGFHRLLFCIVLAPRILFHWDVALLGDITDLEGLFQPIQQFVGELTDILKSV